MNFKCQVVINHPKGSTVPKEFDSLIREGQLYDPIGSHTIKLREYYHCLNEYLHGNKESIIKALMPPKPKHTIQDNKPTPGPKKAGPKKGKKKGGQRARKGRKRKAAAKKEPPNKKKKVIEQEPPAKEEPPTKLDFPIPEFPKKYPFYSEETLKAAPEDKCKMIVKYKGEMSKNQVKEKRLLFIKNIFIQEGCHVEAETDKILLEYLSDILNDFLQKFVRELGYNRLCYPFKGEEDLWGPLETTLRNFGMGGITALNHYYYQNVAKKHDILLNKCMDLYAEFKNSEEKSSQKKELPTDKDVVDVKKCQTSMSTDKDSK